MENLTKDIVILGTGGFSSELTGLLKDCSINIKGYISPNKQGNHFWLGDDSILSHYCKDNKFLIAVGDTKLRSLLTEKILKLGGKLFTFLHPDSYISKDSLISDGCVIYPKSIINSGVKIGIGTLINSGASIGHETEINSFCNISPNSALGGKCKIGKQVEIGIGASIIENIQICDDIKIGAGAVVIKDISTPKSTYVGIPAKKIY